MPRKNTLTIEGWSGAIDIAVGSYIPIERTFGGRKFQKLIVNRRPDQYSSRFGMMANLNKSGGALSWGFAIISLRIEECDDSGSIVSSTTYDFSGVAVADSRISGGDEEITFVFSRKTVFSIANVSVEASAQ